MAGRAGRSSGHSVVSSAAAGSGWIQCPVWSKDLQLSGGWALLPVSSAQAVIPTGTPSLSALSLVPSPDWYFKTC